MKPVNLPTRRITFAVRLLVLAGTCIGVCAAQLPGPAPVPEVAPLPSAPAPQAPPPDATPAGAISGTVTDVEGDAIPGARVTLTRDAQPQPATPLVSVTARDGGFAFTGVPPGAYRLSVDANGFAGKQVSGELRGNDATTLPAIALSPATTTNVQVTADQTEIAQAQINQEEKQRVLGFMPNFYVVYDPNPAPLNPRQKSELAFKTLIDPVNLIITGVAAGAQQATDTIHWEQGVSGYSKRYAAAYGTFLTGDLLTNAALPILFKQDPRYFYKGTGSIRSRALYAMANAVVCKGDNGHWQPNYSGILGGLAASGLSNLYYPAADRAGAAPTLEGAAIGTGFTAVANLIQEFAIRKLTPHLPPHRAQTKP
ncbi:MAG TPA: carboxypeptidase regulatory-like domain-containing protein [Acidobacteriaceae bacterium]|jgi:hypothetical protein